MKNRIVICGLCIGLTGLVTGCGTKLHKDSEFIMGTLVEVTSPDPKAKDVVFAEFRRLESVFSLFDETSELSRLNSSGELKVSGELFDVLKKAKAFYEATGGVFDVTVAPLTLAWKKAIRRAQLPQDQEIQDLLGLVGFDYVYLDENERLVKLLKSGLKIDLGGIAKGYAVDRAVQKLKEARILSALVNAGGNLYGLGKNGERPWRVGIQDPRRSDRFAGRLELEDRAVATSGDYEQFFIFQNKRYSHIINPKTGYPADSGIVSATVTAADAVTADALGTAFLMLGIDGSRRLLMDFPGAQARLIDADGKAHDL